MRKIYQAETIRSAISRSRYAAMLETLPVRSFLIRFHPGELVVSPEDSMQLLLIVVDGALSIYYIRDDGSRFSFAEFQKDAIIGENNLFGMPSQGIYVEATLPLLCLSIDLRENRDVLLNSAPFLRVIAEVQAKKLDAIAMQDAISLSLKDRVLSYMRYKCPNNRLKGVENAAFHLHCSPRQLQRILNDYAREGVIRKVSKGTYILAESPPGED